MINPELIKELKNRNIITQVNIDNEKFNSIDELENYGIATSLYTDEVYEDIKNEMVSDEEYLNNFLNLIKAGGIVELERNIILSNYIKISNEVVINLNGYSITHPATSKDTYKDVFEVMTGGKLTINGEGDIIAEDGYSVYAAGDAIVELNGGNYFSNVTAVDCRKNAHVTINAGTFKVDGTNNKDGDFGQKFTLNLRDKVGNYAGEQSEITVKGGKFYKYNPAASESEPVITNFCAEGYKSVQEGDWYIVRKA